MTIKAPFLYKIKCNTCNSFIEKESLIPDYTCPHGINHEINLEYIGIMNDENMQKHCQKDYKQHRKDLIQLMTVSGSELDMNTLKYASAHFCAPKELRDMFFSLEEQIELGKDFHQRSTESRKNRWNSGLVYLYNYVTLADSFIIGQELELLAFRYLNYGIEGTPEGDAEGLFDYILATSGTSFENTGLAKKELELVVSGVTYSGLADKIISILRAES